MTTKDLDFMATCLAWIENPGRRREAVSRMVLRYPDVDGVQDFYALVESRALAPFHLRRQPPPDILGPVRQLSP